MKRYFLDSHLLPAGFVYPSDFVDFAASGLEENLKPWRFLWADEPEFLLMGLKLRYPTRALVPFARRIGSDDVACFQLNGGNTEVALIHDFAEPGWELRGTLPMFINWLTLARAEAAESIEEEDDD